VFWTQRIVGFLLYKRKKVTWIEIWSSGGDKHQDSSVLECNAVWPDTKLSTFARKCSGYLEQIARHQVPVDRSVWTNQLTLIFFMALWPNAGHGLLILDVFYITHNDAPQSVGLLWTSDQLVAETSTWQYTTLTQDKHPCPRWDSNPRAATGTGNAMLLPFLNM